MLDAKFPRVVDGATTPQKSGFGKGVVALSTTTDASPCPLRLIQKPSCGRRLARQRKVPGNPKNYQALWNVERSKRKATLKNVWPLRFRHARR